MAPAASEPPQSRSVGEVVDIVGTVIGFLALLSCLSLAYRFTGLFVMSTDACFEECNNSRVDLGYLISNFGFVAAVVVAVGGVAFSSSRGWVRTIWPIIGIVLVILAFVVGGSVADTA